MADSLIPAAQYLRMSIDQQRTRWTTRLTAIPKFAAGKGFDIVKTYSDAAKSGLRLKNRAGLQQPLKGVIAKYAVSLKAI
jgi:DNA invertase Pin-like site-specific DNA recombinase